MPKKDRCKENEGSPKKSKSNFGTTHKKNIYSEIMHRIIKT